MKDVKPVVICVDDEQMILNSLHRQLTRRFGKQFEFESCESGEEALELIDELDQGNHQVVMVISDQIMPGMSGDQLLVKIHEKYPRIIKVLLTGQAAVESAINAVNKADLYRYITKPWGESDLLVTVERGIQQYYLKEDKFVLLSEINHRVKNNLAIISGLLQLQTGYVDDENARNYLIQSVNRINSIAKVHELIYQSEDLSSVDVQKYIEKLIPTISDSLNLQSCNIAFKLNIDSTIININQIIALGLLLNELITNSAKHAFNGKQKGMISINLTQKNEVIKIIFEDDGVGFNDEAQFESAGSLGLTLIKLQLAQLDARYTLCTENKFRLEFDFNKTFHGAHGHEIRKETVLV
jgi:two-component sensor histidine kinase